MPQAESGQNQSRSVSFNIPGGVGTVHIVHSNGDIDINQPGNEFVWSVLGPLFNSGVLDPSTAGMGGLRFPSSNIQEEQEWLDQIISRLMDQ